MARDAQQKITDSKNGAESLWDEHSETWRNPEQITSHWQDAASVDETLLQYSVRGEWWETLERLKITLVIGREYEHFLLALSNAGSPTVTFMPMPHPSGIAVDSATSEVHVASTRNPNQIFTLKPVTSSIDRLDSEKQSTSDSPLVPVRSTFFHGCLYMHDLAMIDGSLYANAVGQNSIIKITQSGCYERVWWPKCIESSSGPVFGQNHIQLNSIAAGKNLQTSFFSASSELVSDLRPGHENYPVDKKGVIFSGASREPIARGLTRPHSARLSRDANSKQLWVDNSGYGEFGYIDEEKFSPIIKLPGWTRGLTFCGDVAFVGTSRVIPRFAQYAPGLDVNSSICAVHAIAIKSGQALGSIIWPNGNQIFALEWLPTEQTSGFPFPVKKGRDNKSLFYSFVTD